MSNVDADVAATSVSSNFCIQRLIEVWAERIPDAVAIAAPGRAPLTYKRLWHHLRAVIQALRAMGVARQDRVATVLPQGPELATAFLAVAAGASSAPLNPAYRAHEFDFYISDLHAKALIIQAGLDSPARGVARARGIPIIELLPKLDVEAGMFTLTGRQHAQPVDGGFAQSEDVALVLHTSGTTARPKAVPLTHTNLCASAQNIAATLTLSESDRCLNIMPLFHIHGLIGGTLASLASGGSVVCPPGFYAPQFFAWLDEFRPTWYTAVPAMHQSILKRASAHREMTARRPLRFIRSSSAPLPRTVMTELEDLFKVPVIEAYGMTEASHQIASNPLPPRQRKMGSVGVATGSEIAIIDEQGKYLSAGRNGEIIIRGPNITQGYENHPDLNKEAFADGWFGTGDQGYLDEDGYLFITGRLKEMINRGGEKISPREVDDVLMDHPAVRQAVTFAVPHPTLGEDVAAAVVLHEKASVGEREIQEFAASRLADFKVPRKVLIVDEIPRTATGKLQRIDLAKKFGVKATDNGDPDVGANYVRPRTAVEEKIVEIWSQVLGVDQVGIHDNFFALGGDSILAAQIISRVRKAIRVELSFLSFIETPTIAGMVKSLEAGDRKFPALPTVTRPPLSDNQGAPVSCVQERFLKQPEPGNAAHARPTFFRLAGRLDVASLKQSLDEIVRRHDVLRTSFSLMDGQWVQLVSPPQPVNLPVVDLSGLSEPRRSTEARRLSTEEAERPFNLARGTLLRATLLRLKDDEHMLLLAIHHIAFDGWSQGVLLRELGLLYQAFCVGQSSPLPRLSIQYADFAVWQRKWLQGKMLQTQLAYWKKQLAGIPRVLSLPTDRPRPAVQTFRGARESIALSPALTKAVKLLSRRTEVSLFMTLLAAFQTLLYRYTDEADVSVGTFIANRTSLETESLIGCFANNLVLRTDLSGNPSFRELLGRVREVCSGAYAHQNLPFVKLVEELDSEPCLSHSPLFQVMFVLQNTPQSHLELSSLTVERYPAMDANRSNFDFTLEMSEDAGCLTGFFEYNTDLFDAATMRRMVEHFRTLLEGIVSNPDERLSTLNLNSSTVHDPLARRARLAQRQSRLSTAQQAALAQRLSGKLGSNSETFHALEHPEQDSVARTLKPIDQNSATLSDDDRLNCRGSKAAPAPGLNKPLKEYKAERVAFPKSAGATVRVTGTRIQKASRERPIALSFAQERLWFLDQLLPHNSFYNMARAIRLKGKLDTGALERSINEIIRRHEVLRTTFSIVNGKPVQVISSSANRSLAVEELSHLSEAEREVAVQRLAAEEAKRPFDLARGPLLRAKLVGLGNNDHVLLVAMHHIVSDGWSMGIFSSELSVLYGVYSTGKPSPLPELSIQYADYAVWQRQWLQGEILETQLSYWKKQLAGAPARLELPTDRPRPGVQSFRGARQATALPEALTNGLKSLSRQEGVTLFMTLLAAFQTLIHRDTGQHDIVVGSPIAGRNRTEIEGLIGFFVNTLVLRTDLSGDPSFRELLARVRTIALDAYSHQDVPFEKLVEALHPQRNFSHSPLFQVFFALQNAPLTELTLTGLTVDHGRVARETSTFELSLLMTEEAGCWNAAMEYNTDLFDGTTIARIMGHFQTLLEGIASNPNRRISELPLLTQTERQQLLVEWNDTKRDYANDNCIHELFEARVDQAPDAVAVIFEDEEVTYRELNARANQLAHYLGKLGVGPETIVGICMERSQDMVVGLLGILKAGGAYVPLDPAYPQERLAFMLQDSRAPMLLTQKQLWEGLCQNRRFKPVLSEAEAVEDGDFRSSITLLNELGGLDGQLKVVCLDADWELISRETNENPVVNVRPDNLAYVIYTSGSTGKPKGVLINHSNVTRLLHSTRSWFHFDENDVWTVFHSYAFDFSVWEMWGALLYGGRLVVVSYWVSRSPEVFYKLLSEKRVTVLNQTPSAFRQLIQAEEYSIEPQELALRLVIFGGEALDFQTLKPWFERHGDRHPRLVNMYGITETTVHVTYRPITAADVCARRGSLIGLPLPDLELYVLDGNQNPVPIGVPGELYVGGAGVGRGYLNRPELTAERFIPNLFSPGAGERLYRSGDLVRYLPDRDIEYLGRIDAQIKLRGFRIELGEIEARLSQHPAVRNVVVVSREDEPTEKRLVAYMVPTEQAPTVSELNSFLRERLPEYMVPASFVFVDALPLTPNGKVDRRSLPAPDQCRPEQESAFVTPRTPVEELLAKIWAELLKVERVGIHDNFFELGGHSLLITQVASRIQQAFQVYLPLRTLFDAPTIALLSVAVATAQLGEEDVARSVQMLEELKQLSPDEVKALLEAESRLSPSEGEQ